MIQPDGPKPRVEYTEQGWRYPVDRMRHHRESGWNKASNASLMETERF